MDSEHFNPPPFEVNERGMNSKIRATVLPDERMREIGFTNFDEPRWYFCKSVGEKNGEISFNVTIPKARPDLLQIDVLDDDFLQPYDFQHLLEVNPDFKFALEVWRNVERWMKTLADAGVISGHEYGEYI